MSSEQEPAENNKPNRSPCFTYCSNFPYSFFSLRRRPPGQSKHEKRKLAFTKELPHSFDYRFWDFDMFWIDIAQYFHYYRSAPLKKHLGLIIALLSYLISYAAAIEVQALLLLFLTFHGYDSLARVLTHFLLLNTLTYLILPIRMSKSA